LYVQAKVIAALNLALHPNTIDADIVAGIRGAYRLLGGKTLAGFLGLSASQETLLAELRDAEAKVEGAVEYCNELKLEIQRLQEELAARIKPATPRRLPHGKIAIGLFVATICVGLFAVPLFLNPRPIASRPADPQTQPPSVTYTSRPGWTNEYGQACREYTLNRQGSVNLEYGVACRGTDGLWRIYPQALN
jgi:hypothetical protein